MSDIQIINDDCLNVLPTLESASVDAIITDPPYAIVNKFGVQKGAPGNGHRVLQFEWDTGAALDTITRGVEAAIALIQRPGAAFVFCGFDSVGPVQEVLRAAKMTPKPYVWIKDCPPPPGKGNWWPSGFEIGVYAYHTGAWFGDSEPSRSNVYRGDTLRNGNGEKVGHPTQKPLHIMRHLVKSLCPRGGTVLDPFAGSGTTGVAALKTGRKAILIERESAYVEIIHRRLADAATPLLDALEGVQNQ